MPDAKGKRTPDEEALASYKAAWAEAEPKHQERCARYDKQERAYHARLEPQDDVGYHNLAPHYAYEVVELLAANLVDDHPKGKVTAKQSGREAGARLNEKIIAAQRDEDARDEKLPIWVKRALVHNLSPAKVSWAYEQRKRKRRNFRPNPAVQGGYDEGAPVEVNRVACDRPTLTLLDPRDFIYDPHARSIDECAYILARFYETKESLRKQEKRKETDSETGQTYDYGIYKNLDEIKTDQGSTGRSRKNRVTVVEYWTRERIIVVANNAVVIRDDENPYWHGDLPFVAMVLVPDLRSLAGMSVVETIAPLQTALHRSLNQRLDMAEIVLNPPIVQSIEASETLPVFKPGARYFEHAPDTLRFLQTPISILAAAIENAAQIKGDMRDISGAVPALSGAASETIDQKTATGISLIQSVAQQRLKRMRTQAGVAEKRCGRLELEMNLQLIRRPDAIRIDSKDGASWEPYTPDKLQGDYDYGIDDVNEALDQQKRRDEATLKVQTLMMLNQAQPGLVNVKALGEDFLEAFDEDDPSRFFNDAPAMPGMPPMGMPGPPPPMGGGMPPPPPGPLANGAGGAPVSFLPGAGGAA